MLNNKIGFLSPEHKSDYIDALEITGAVGPDNGISSYFGASLYLLTGLRGAWSRLKRYIGCSFIDHGAALDDLRLSRGEVLIVRLAGNLYNGGFWEDSPWDLISELDAETFGLSLEALRLRKCRLLYNGEEVIEV